MTKRPAKNQNSLILAFILAIPFLFVSFTVSIDPVMIYIQLGAEVICCVLYLFLKGHKPMILNNLTWVLISLYIVPWLFSISVGYLHNYIVGNSASFADITPYGRMANIFTLSFFLFLLSLEHRENGVILKRHVINLYYIGLCILLLAAFWQLADWYLNFPIPFPFETRSHLHGAGDLVLSFSNRLTAYAAEPSYLAPLLTDGIILSTVVFHKKLPRIVSIGIFLLVIFFTYSPSAYFSLLAVALCFFIIKFKRYAVFALGLLFVLIMVGATFLSEIQAVQYFLERIEGYSSSGRFQGVIWPIEYIFREGDVLSILFGYGMKSMDALREAGLNGFEFGTSNTVFSDILFECGLVGLVCYVSLFTLLLWRSLRIAKNDSTALLLWTNFFVGSFYVGEFGTLRFIGMIFLIYMFSAPSSDRFQSQVAYIPDTSSKSF